MRDFSDALTGPASQAQDHHPDSILLRISGLGQDGLPAFAPPFDSTGVMLLDPLPDDAAGQFAVCKWLAAPRGVMVVLAVVDAAQMVRALAEKTAEAPTPCDQAPLVLRHGKACITLHADGRIRLDGEDVGLDAKGPLSLRAATIDLN